MYILYICILITEVKTAWVTTNNKQDIHRYVPRGCIKDEDTVLDSRLTMQTSLASL